MSEEKSKEYTNGEITIVWKPGKCIHAGVCVKTLPDVYDPKARPWINVDNATTEALKNQVTKCPSGALSYFMNDENDQEATELETKVEVLKDGPLLVYGTLKVKSSDGKEEIKNRSTAFCRCGASNNKPYCDGNHIAEGFEG